jgi:hypothetical protein
MAIELMLAAEMPLSCRYPQLARRGCGPGEHRDRCAGGLCDLGGAHDARMLRRICTVTGACPCHICTTGLALAVPSKAQEPTRVNALSACCMQVARCLLRVVCCMVHVVCAQVIISGQLDGRALAVWLVEKFETGQWSALQTRCARAQRTAWCIVSPDGVLHCNSAMLQNTLCCNIVYYVATWTRCASIQRARCHVTTACNNTT